MPCTRGGRCHTTTYPEGHGFRVDVPLDLDMEMNDARAAGAPPLEWWVELAVRWVPGSAPIIPLSSHGLLAAGSCFCPIQINDCQRQSCMDGYVRIPPHVPMVTWYSVHMPFATGGTLVSVHPHLHGHLQRRAYVFAAAPSELGLNRPAADEAIDGEGSTNASPLGSSALPFASFGAFEAHLNQPGFPAPVCVYTPQTKLIDGVAYDLAGGFECRPWTFAPSQLITVVSLLHFEEGRKLPPWLDQVPSEIPIHLTLFFHFVATPPSPAALGEKAPHSLDPTATPRAGSSCYHGATIAWRKAHQSYWCASGDDGDGDGSVLSDRSPDS